jgi:hypothetical protein
VVEELLSLSLSPSLSHGMAAGGGGAAPAAVPEHHPHLGAWPGAPARPHRAQARGIRLARAVLATPGMAPRVPRTDPPPRSSMRAASWF